MTIEQKTVGVCATCPWRLANQGKPHPAKWYSMTNLKRLWQGVRSGQAPGMVCHSTDPQSKDYGSTKTVPETATTVPCGGLIAVVVAHSEQVVQHEYKGYRKLHKYPMTRAALADWTWRSMLHQVPSVAVRDRNEIGLPESWNVELPGNKGKEGE